MIANAALQAGLPASAMSHHEEMQQVVDELQNTLKDGDVVLVKGSHGLRMDHIVSALEESV
ncbi:hypothetical protein EG834_12220 [bacterium]|nr:hypothetical protein [bacterium]